MKLLFDENLSPQLVLSLSLEYPQSMHVVHAGLEGKADEVVWDFAKIRYFTIVSKDNDFRQRAFVFGPPPKVVWLQIGNAGTAAIEVILRSNQSEIQKFHSEPNEALLTLKHKPQLRHN